ncbi:MAG: bifunctional UDP-N-acetylglucosamine diphosphorylase/glucosamine-1-phosphate N-acetyltransferase GlmU [Pseudomonadota bacterium]
MAESASKRAGYRALAVIVLAAGKGTRMRSTTPKVLHPLAGMPMLGHVLTTAQALAPERVAVVVGNGAEQVTAAATAILPGVRICRQREQRGTGHAVMAANEALDGFEGDVLVLYGDTPLLTRETLVRLRSPVAATDSQPAVRVLGFEADDPARYGRLITDAEGSLTAIVEAKNATPDQLAVTRCNSGVMAADAATLRRLLAHLTDDNAQGEYLLTDLVGLAVGEGRRAEAVLCPMAETMGINDRAELAAAEALWQARARTAAMRAGVTMTAPATVTLSHDTVLEPDVTLGPGVVFAPGVTVRSGARIEAYCHLADTEIGPRSVIGPFARLRGGCTVGADTRIGNFVEMKATDFGNGAKAAHLTYVGDASVGAGANLGCGTVTCNYDGVDKHRTTIGAGAFIGTNSALIAPVAIGAGAYVATGTVVTRDVPDDALAIARTAQSNREGAAGRLRAAMLARKAARGAKKG